MSEDALTVSVNGERAFTPRWIPAWVRQVITVLPVGLTVGIGVFGLLLRSSRTTLFLAIVAALLVITWFLRALEPLLIGGILLLGIEVAVATGGYSDIGRDIAACGAGSALYLIHASAMLSVTTRRVALVDVRVLRRWAGRNLPIACVSLTGLLAALGGHAAGDDRLILAAAAIVIGGGSLVSVWLFMFERPRTTDRALGRRPRGME
jgi:hypothetical protein